MNVFLGIDAGTSSVKAALFREDGTLLSDSSYSYPTAHPGPACAEQNSEDWWNSTADAIASVLHKATLAPQDRIAALSVSSQTPSLVPLGQDMEPLRPAMIWMDRRAEEEINEIVQLVGAKRYRQILGAAPDSYYLLPKLLWYKKHEPELYDSTKKILMTNSYINYKLTGVCAMDPLQAIATHAMDIDKRLYSAELEELLELPLSSLLPAIYASDEIIGTVTREASIQTGLPQGTPVCAGTTDTMASILGLGLFSPGMVGDITGTSSLICFADKNKTADTKGKMLLRPSLVPDVGCYLVGTINATGASTEWFCRTVQMPMEENPLKHMDELAKQAKAGSGGLIFFPYLSGERTPLWNTHAKGMYIGLTLSTGRPELARAVLEGTSYASRHVRDTAVELGVKPNSYICAGGGAKSDIWLRIKASVMGQAIQVAESGDAATRGNAILAGIASGYFTDVREAAGRFVKIQKTVEPVKEWADAYNILYPYYLSMYESLDSNLLELSENIRRIKT